MYYSNVLTSTRGAVRAAVQFYVASSASAPSIVAGRGFTVTGVATSVFTVYFPERYYKTPWLSTDSIPTSTHNACYTVFQTGITVPSTGPAYCQVQFVAPTSGVTNAGVIPYAALIFVEVEAELGF